MNWQHYTGAAIGIGVLTAAISTGSAGHAIAQGVLKPVQAFIVNTAGDPVPVVDVGAPSRLEPFQVSADAGGDVFEVPAGKVFVIEHLSGRVDTSPACDRTTIEVSTRIGDTVHDHHFTMTDITTSTFSRIWILSATTRLYGAGQVGISYNGFSGGCDFVVGPVAFSGHLVDAP